jgi:hypothetical protein
VPDADNGGGRWALDHLFLDQDGIPTFVEVKRSTDSRLRREVVGQMLDYAASAVVYWSMEQIRSNFEEAHRRQGQEPETVLLDFLAGTPFEDPEAYWAAVKTNLHTRRIRLVFVADVIPVELRRIVEFLNQQMSLVEVLAVEVRQFAGQGVTALVPTVYGATVTGKEGPSGQEPRQWHRKSFLAAVADHDPSLHPVATRLLEWAEQAVSSIYWSRGRVSGGFVPGLRLSGGRRCFLFGCSVDGLNAKVQMYFGVLGVLKDRPPFQDPARREELR